MIPGLGRSPGEEHGNPLQYSPVSRIPMHRGAWWAAVHGVTKSTFLFYMLLFLQFSFKYNSSKFWEFIYQDFIDFLGGITKYLTSSGANCQLLPFPECVLHTMSNHSFADCPGNQWESNCNDSLRILNLGKVCDCYDQ